MSAPIPGTRQLLADLDLTIDDIDLFEHNEAFATASCAVRANLEVPDDMFNVSGGAIALGHPLGASGARILTTLVHNLQRTGEHRGLATLCLGGGNSVQMVVERTE
jgi:acetyl-CoA C-acetyltransferase